MEREGGREGGRDGGRKEGMEGRRREGGRILALDSLNPVYQAATCM